MIKIIVVVVLFTLVTVVLSDKDVSSQWNEFKLKYNKSYTAAEEVYRFKIFSQNVDLAAQRSAKSITATHGVTKFSDLTPEEFKKLFLSIVPERSVNNGDENPSQFRDLPDTFDWRTKGAVTAVKNQGQCGSCWAFAAVETVESVCYLAGYGLYSASEQQVVDCDKGDMGCNGGEPTGAYQYLIKAGGIETEAAYPYNPSQTTCTFNSSQVYCPVTSWKSVTNAKNETVMQEFCYSNSPMAACVDAMTWSTYTGGYISVKDDCGWVTDHCVQIVGWTSMSGVSVWTVRNSWGSDWGVSGYIYLQMDHDVCGIADSPSVPCVKAKDGSIFC